jgi:uncharacterized protein (TIGR02145 family)
LYTCKPSINTNGIYLKTPVSYQGESYEAVLIGTQTWLARNLNYDVKDADNSVCYGDLLGGDKKNMCDTYGRLYSWAAAMALPTGNQDCNNNFCSSQVRAKHQGICPAGWHIPSKAEWDSLMATVGGPSTAGRYLKAKSDWSANGTLGNGEDTYGFNALPGGARGGGGFTHINSHGFWQSASESGSNAKAAYHLTMNYSSNKAIMDASTDSKYYLLSSVRCVKD